MWLACVERAGVLRQCMAAYQWCALESLRVSAVIWMLHSSYNFYNRLGVNATPPALSSARRPSAALAHLTQKCYVTFTGSFQQDAALSSYLGSFFCSYQYSQKVYTILWHLLKEVL